MLFTQFLDKITVLAASSPFLKDNTQNELELRQIMSLRDRLAHANDYAATPEEASIVCRTVRLIDKWRKDLMSWFQPCEEAEPNVARGEIQIIEPHDH